MSVRNLVLRSGIGAGNKVSSIVLHGLANQGATGTMPTVTGLAPTTGTISGGTAVTISGSAFTGATAVAFGATAAGFSVTSDTAIAATSPAHAAGIVDVTVTTPGGTSATGPSDKFTYTGGAPPVIKAAIFNSGMLLGTPSGLMN